jgi:hypothetical protein
MSSMLESFESKEKSTSADVKDLLYNGRYKVLKLLRHNDEESIHCIEDLKDPFNPM